MMPRLRNLWNAMQWPLLGLLGTAALVLGSLGFRAHSEAADEPLGVLAAAYRSIQFFVLEIGAPSSTSSTDGPQLRPGIRSTARSGRSLA